VQKCRPSRDTIETSSSVPEIQIRDRSRSLLLRYAEDEQICDTRVYLILNQDRRSDEEEVVFEYVASRLETTVRDLQRNLLCGKSSDHVEAIVNELVKKGRIKEVVLKGKGRPSRTYSVN
jgi:hypothetical protein